jgi:4-amino-4-deoxy-L-arabinose transferase-like glycosyltransferase
VRSVWGAVDRLSRLPIWAVLVVAVAARLVAGFAFPAATTPTYEFGRIADNVVEGRGYTYFPADADGPLRPGQADQATRWLPSAYMPPLYTGVVVAAREIGGSSHAGLVWAVRGLNLLLTVGAIGAVHGLTRRLVGSGPAPTLAALGFALYPPLVYGATQVSAANLYVPLETVTLLALLAAAAAGTGAWRPWIAAALALGLLCLVRAEAVLLIPLAALWLAWAAAGTPWRRVRAGLALGFVAVAAVLPAAWLVRNTAVLGEPTTTIATSGGVNLWIGNHPGASGSQKSFAIPRALRTEIAHLPADDRFELRQEAVFRREALDDMTRHPVATAGRDLRKLALLLGADVYDHRSLNPAYLAAWAGLAAIGTAGLVAWWRDRDRPTRVLIGGFLAVNVAIPVVFFALARYRLPIEVMLLTFTGAWLAERAERSGVRPYRTTSTPPEASTVTSLPSAISPSSSAIASRSAT